VDKPTLDALKLKYDSSPAYAGSDLAAVIAEVERLRSENEALRTEADRLRRDLPNASETVG
jgi:hypothetical protein